MTWWYILVPTLEKHLHKSPRKAGLGHSVDQSPKQRGSTYQGGQWVSLLLKHQCPAHIPI